MKKYFIIVCLLGNLTGIKAEIRKDTIEIINILAAMKKMMAIEETGETNCF